MTNYIGFIVDIPEFPCFTAFYAENVFNEPEFVKEDESKKVSSIIHLNIETELINRYKVTGVITENSVPVKRTVRLYRHSTGEVVDETESDSSGNYELITAYNERHYVVCLSLDVGQSYNHLIRKDVEIINR